MATILRRLSFWLAVAFVSTAPVAAPVSAVTFMATQAPCSPEMNCSGFVPSSTVVEVRSFTFNAPGKGIAQVFFNGSMSCGNYEKRFAVVVDLQSQIVNLPNAQPSYNGPSGLRLATVLENANEIPYIGFIQPEFDSFDLASTRMFKVTAAGSQTYRFKIGKLRMDAGSLCSISNAAFSVIYTSTP